MNKQDIVLRDKIGSQMFAEIQHMSAYEAVEHIKRCSQ